MTKILLVSIATMMAFNTQAQIKKNSILAGGNISVSNSDRDKDTPLESESGGYNIHLSIGSAIKDNSVPGIFLLYGHSNSESPGPGIIKQKGKTYGGGFFYRKYKPLVKNLYIFGEGEIGVASSENISTYSTPDKTSSDKVFRTFLNFQPGLSYQLIKILQLQISLPNLLSIDHSSYKTKYTGNPTFEAKQDNFSLSTGLSGNFLNTLAIGFRLVF